MINPEDYLEQAMARQVELISEANLDRLLQSARPPRRPAIRSIRNSAAQLLHRLADQLQVEPDLATAVGST